MSDDAVGGPTEDDARGRPTEDDAGGGPTEADLTLPAALIAHARAFYASGAAPVTPRRAATVLLLREPGPEVYAIRRAATMAFAAGMHVFPGGRVDPGDAHPDLAARSVLTGQDCATALGGDLDPAGALAAHVAAIRELFEEAGVLLADAGPVEVALPGRAVSEARSALVGGEASFVSIVAELHLRLRTDWLVALSRWVTRPSNR